VRLERQPDRSLPRRLCGSATGAPVAQATRKGRFGRL